MKKLKEVIHENHKFFVLAVFFSILNILCFVAMFWFDLWILSFEGVFHLRGLFLILIMIFSSASVGFWFILLIDFLEKP